MRKRSVLMLVIAASFALAASGLIGCGGGGGGTTGPVSVNTLDGATDIPVDSTFQYTFSSAVTTSTVTTSTYFIVPTPAAEAAQTLAAIDETICDSTNALEAVISCPNFTQCTLDPAEDLTGGISYTICLTTEIDYLGGSSSPFSSAKQLGGSFEGFMATFTTAGGGSAITISSAKLVKLDGTEVDFDATPIPRKVAQKYTFSEAVTEEADRTAIQAAIVLKDADENTIEGSWAWSEDYTTATFTPTFSLDFKTEYTVTVDSGSMPVVSVSQQAAADTMSFTTLMPRDVNGDGYDDAIVGASRNDGNTGQAYFFYGSADGIDDCDLSGACTADATFTGAAATNFLGGSVVMAGDVNGDGYIDLLIGASAAQGADGQAYIFHGSANGISDCDLSGTCTPSSTLTGPDGQKFGEAGGFAGDVNGDGYDDIIIGGTHAAGTGRAFVFNGSATGIGDRDLSDGGTADATFVAAADNTLFGGSVSGAGDVNGDGYDDVIVGEQVSNKAYVFRGSAEGVQNCDLSGGCTANATIDGDGLLGESVGMLGDVDGDGYDDVIVGASNAGPGGDKRGRAYILKGSADGIGDCSIGGTCSNLLSTISGDDADDELGDSVYTAGDVDGDGTPDILVGANQAEGGGTARGQAYVFLGSGLSATMTPAGDADAIFTGPEDNSRFGDKRCSSTVGDVNGDGYDDVIVGAYDVGNVNETGAAYIFKGSADGPTTCDLSGGCSATTTFIGAADGDDFGVVR